MIPKYQDGLLMQEQLSKQKLLQLQHQRNICETIFTTMSSAEKVALKLSKSKEYSSYDPMNSASYKNEIQLQNELASKLVYCQGGLIAFKTQHGDFIFPDKNIKQEMINDIKKWEILVKNKPKALESYQLLIQLIEGNTIDIPEECFYQTKDSIDEKDRQKWVDGMVGMQKELDNQNKDVQNRYEEGKPTVPFKKRGYYDEK